MLATAVILIWHSGLETADRLAGIGSFLLSSLALLTAFGGRRSQWPARSLDEHDAALRDAVREQWRAEERLRRLQDPAPIPVRWAAPNAGTVVQDHWANVRRVGHTRGVTALELSGRLAEIADGFRRIPSRRLVVLGDAGSGKSVLLIRLVLDLIENHRPGDPTPVLLSVTSWAPTRQDFPAWLTYRLITDYPALAAPHRDFGTVAAALVAGDRILPVLDGLDELPERVQGRALLALNAALPQPAGLVLASRAEPYGAAVQAGDVLTGAAVIQLQPLLVTDLAAYLPLTARAVGTSAATLWDSVLRRLEEDPANGRARVVAGVLSTALMTSLARSVYSDTGTDPAEMFDPARFATAGDLAGHLLDRAIPVAYQHAVTGVAVPEADRAAGWLAWLAGHATPEVAWWRLPAAAPRIVLGTTGAVAGSVTLGMVAWCIGGGAAGLAGAAVLGGGATALVVLRQPLVPTGLRLGLSLRPRPGRGWPPARPSIGIVGWLAGGLSLTAALWSVAGPASALTGCCAVVAARVLDTWLDVPADVASAASPAAVLRSDRRTALSKAAVRGIILGVTAGVLIGISAGLAITAATAVASTLFTAWGRFSVARAWFALRGELPWRLMPFLDDAHRRGILRQAGAVYQFRHARLRERLINHASTLSRQYR